MKDEEESPSFLSLFTKELTVPLSTVREAPKPLDVPDAHVPEVGDIYEYSGRHWRVHKLADVRADFMSIEPGSYMAGIPVGYVQKYMRRIWPED